MVVGEWGGVSGLCVRERDTGIGITAPVSLFVVKFPTLLKVHYKSF